MKRSPSCPKGNQSSVSRRRFLSSSCLAVTGAAVGLPAVLGEEKSGTHRPVIGAGEQTYEVFHDWGALPEGHRYGNTHGVCHDRQGYIYVKHTVGKGAVCEDAVVVFDPSGRFVRSFGAEFKGGAHGLHLHREGGEEFLYFCDTARKNVVKTTLTGEPVLEFPFPDGEGMYARPEEYVPTNVAIAPNGLVFVADGYGKSFVHRYTTSGEYLDSFAGAGSEAGKTKCPHGLMVDLRAAEPELVVADRSNRRLQYFDLKGQSLRFVTEELRAPCHFDERGGILLVPDLEARVTLLDEQNQLVVHLGDGTHYRGIRDQPREAFTPGKFIAPHGAMFDEDGNIFVVEWVEVGRVTKLKRVV